MTSLTTEKPLIELKLFKIRTYALSVFYIGIMYAIYFGSVVLVPLWLQTSMNYTSIWAGIAVAPIGIAPFIAGPFMGKALTKFGVPLLLSVCFLLFALSCFYTAYFDTDVDIWHIGFSRFLLGCAMVFFITPLFALSMQDVPKEKLPSSHRDFPFCADHVRRGSEPPSLQRCGLGAAPFTTRWSEKILPSTPLKPLSYLEQLGDLGLRGQTGLEKMNIDLTQQADILSINDCFFLMGWVFLGLLLVLPLSRTKKGSVKNSDPSPVAAE